MRLCSMQTTDIFPSTKASKQRLLTRALNYLRRLREQGNAVVAFFFTSSFTFLSPRGHKEEEKPGSQKADLHACSIYGLVYSPS